MLESLRALKRYPNDENLTHDRKTSTIQEIYRWKQLLRSLCIILPSVHCIDHFSLKATSHSTTFDIAMCPLRKDKKTPTSLYPLKKVATPVCVTKWQFMLIF